MNKDESIPEAGYRLYTLIDESPRFVSQDAAFLLSVGGHSKVFYLEQDRATSGVHQIATSKTKGYAVIASGNFIAALCSNVEFTVLMMARHRAGAMRSGRRSKKSPRASYGGSRCTVDLRPETLFSDPIFFPCAEQHAVTFAAGLAAEGYKPFAAIYSTFLQRAYDQVVHDVAVQGLPVRFAIDRAGLVGADGPTHAGSFDVAYLSCLPGMVVMAAADEAELMHMVATAAGIDDRPSALRYPRGEGIGVALPKRGTPLEIGKGRVLREGSAVALLSFGARLPECLVAADQLAGFGLPATVADARFAKPLDMDLLRRLAQNHEVLITVEEGSSGGFGAMVLQALAREGLLDRGLKVRTLHLPDVFIEQNKPAAMYAEAGLDASGVVAAVFTALGKERDAAGVIRLA